MTPTQKLFTRFNAWLIRVSGGRIGGQLGAQSVLLLQTVGRKSGQPRTTPVSFYRDGGNYLIVASNWGAEHMPDWYYNLQAQPKATIQVYGQQISVTSHLATGAEYARLWQLVTSKNNQFVEYQKSTQRQIPVVILTPN